MRFGALPVAVALTLGVLFAACENPEPEVVPLDESNALEQVGTIEIQETDERFIGEFESIDVTLDPFRLYIADRRMHRVAVVDGNSGEILHLIGEHGEGPGELDTPERAIQVADSLIVEDGQSQLSVFMRDGEFLHRTRLPEGVWRGGRWTLTGYDENLYMAIEDIDPRADGLQATPDQNVVAQLDDNFRIAEAFGSYPPLYQGRSIKKVNTSGGSPRLTSTMG